MRFEIGYNIGGLGSPHQSLIELECFGQKKRLGEVVRCVAVGLCHRKCVASPLDHRPFFERHYRAFSQASFTWVTNLTESCYFEGVTCHHPSEHIGLAELNLIQLNVKFGI